MVKKSQPASSRISPVLRKEAPAISHCHSKREGGVGTHDDGLVAVLFVVVVDLLDGFDAWILSGRILLLMSSLVPESSASK
jgi:hypothetical protein